MRFKNLSQQFHQRSLNRVFWLKHEHIAQQSIPKIRVLLLSNWLHNLDWMKWSMLFRWSLANVDPTPFWFLQIHWRFQRLYESNLHLQDPKHCTLMEWDYCTFSKLKWLLGWWPMSWQSQHSTSWEKERPRQDTSQWLGSINHNKFWSHQEWSTQWSLIIISLQVLYLLILLIT